MGTKVDAAKLTPTEIKVALANLRREYTLAGLKEQDLDPDPIRQFQKWFQEALSAGILEPNAMVLATADKSGRPSSRTLLLKRVDQRGFVFFTNYLSRKGRELADNPHAAMTFPWLELERQVCITGKVSKVSREEAEAYFKMRPRGSRLGAHVSIQSSVISGREELEKKLQQIEARYPSDEIPPPDYWGGYALAPDHIEFWQGRPNRLHDRLRYARQADGSWKIERLSP
jgi:pyridoxamine 5'-phosphate oxidase